MFAVHLSRELVLVVADFVIAVDEAVFHVVVLETITIGILLYLECVPEVDLAAVLGQLVPDEYLLRPTIVAGLGPD